MSRRHTAARLRPTSSRQCPSSSLPAPGRARRTRCASSVTATGGSTTGRTWISTGCSATTTGGFSRSRITVRWHAATTIRSSAISTMLRVRPTASARVVTTHRSRNRSLACVSLFPAASTGVRRHAVAAPSPAVSRRGCRCHSRAGRLRRRPRPVRCCGASSSPSRSISTTCCTGRGAATSAGSGGISRP